MGALDGPVAGVGRAVLQSGQLVLVLGLEPLVFPQLLAILEQLW